MAKMGRILPFQVILLVIMAGSLVHASIPVTFELYKVVLVSSSSWIPDTTVPLTLNMAGCSSLCATKDNCFAFAYDVSTKTCELGPRANLIDPAGRPVYKSLTALPTTTTTTTTTTTATTTYPDCRSDLAKSQGYSLFNGNRWLLAHNPGVSSMQEGMSKCEEAGGQLVMFKENDDWLAVKTLLDGEFDRAFYVGLKVTATASTADTMCDSSTDPSGCQGIYEWVDGSAFQWGQTEFNDWAPPVVRKDSGETCAMLDGDPGSKVVDDVPCDRSLRPICHVPCP